NVDELLMRVGERVAEFYKRAQHVICIETSTVQPVDLNNSPYGFTRTVESELRVEAESGEAPGEAAIVRKIRKVNGRVPREKDKKDRAGCTDPNPLSSEPLEFLRLLARLSVTVPPMPESGVPTPSSTVQATPTESE